MMKNMIFFLYNGGNSCLANFNYRWWKAMHIQLAVRKHRGQLDTYGEYVREIVQQELFTNIIMSWLILMANGMSKVR